MLILLQDEKELIRNLASAIGGNEAVLMAEEYLNPGQVASQATLNTPVDTPLPSTPTQKFFPPNMPPPPYSSHTQLNTHRNSRYGSTPGVNEAFSTMGSRRYNSNFFSQSCDPLKMLEDDIPLDCASYGGPYNYSNTTGRNPNKTRPPNVTLPLDAEDYLVPSPQSPPPATPNSINNNHKNAYMDLISDKPGQNSGHSGQGMFQYPPPHSYFVPGMHGSALSTKNISAISCTINTFLNPTKLSIKFTIYCYESSWSTFRQKLNI